MSYAFGRHFFVKALVAASTLLTVAAASEGRAAKLAVVVRGVGPGADKAAATVAHYAHDAWATDERYETIGITQALGNPDRDKALRHFTFAEGLFQKARDAYARIDLDVADSALRNCLAQYERHAGYVYDYKKVAEALMLLGAVRILRGDERMGQSYLEQAINAYPEVEPDPRIFNPSMRARFAQTASQLSGRPHGNLALSSSPGACAVWVDGRFVGVTPVVVEDLNEGRHYVRIERDGYRPWGKVLSVGSNGETADNAPMRPAVHFEEYDAAVDRALRTLDDGGDKASAPLAQLARLLGVDALFAAQVRLDGERVRVAATTYDTASKRYDKPAQHVFAYEPRIQTYEREVAILLRQSFGYGAPAQAPASIAAASPGAGRRGRDAERAERSDRLARGEPPPPLRGQKSALRSKYILGSTLNIVGGAAVVGGAVEWLLAKNSHDKWRKIPQTGPGHLTYLARGRNQALIGDLLMGGGLALSLAGVLTWTLWHPSANVTEVLDAPDEAPKKPSGHSARHFMLDVVPTTHGAVVLPTWTY